MPMVIKQKTNARTGVLKLPNNPAPTPKEIAMDAPKAAPEEIPSMDGDAIGFLKRLCIAKPETESPAPTRQQQSSLGMRTSNSMYLSPDDPPPLKSMSKTCPGDSL